MTKRICLRRKKDSLVFLTLPPSSSPFPEMVLDKEHSLRDALWMDDADFSRGNKCSV